MNHIKIDLERTVSDIDRNIFGGYMELGYLEMLNLNIWILVIHLKLTKACYPSTYG